MELSTIITVVLSIVTLVAGGFWLNAKGKLSLIANLVKETYDVIDAVIKALDDDKLSKEETEKIKAEALEVKAAWKKIWGK